MTFLIRTETPSDAAAIRDVTERAFASVPYAGGNEQDIVEALRRDSALAVSLVAEQHGRVVGHVAFSPAVAPDGASGWFTLGPVSVDPSWQRQGVGRSLVTAGLEHLRSERALGCLVVGDVRYYSRFGFVPAPAQAPSAALAEHFMILTFGDAVPQGALDFHPAFYI